MRRELGTAALLVAALGALSSCSGDGSEPPGTNPREVDGLRLVAQDDVMLSDTPLGDVQIGRLTAGDEVTALCFVRRAQTNAGFIGSAIQVVSGEGTAYAALTDFPADPADRRATFDVEPDAIGDRLPACSV
jgi:hypothetical protein